MTGEILFAIEAGQGSQSALEALEREFRLGREDLGERPLTYYDSFDWRIFSAGGNLTAAAAEGGEVEISWHTDNGAALHQCRLPAFPSFVWDFPPGKLRDELTPILKMRRLLPVVEVKRRGVLLRILNRDEKTVARVSIEEALARAPGGAETPLASYLRLLPVRGYDKAQHKVLRLVEGQLGLERVEHHELTLALASIGCTPRSYSSKVSVRLDLSSRADEAAVSIFRALLEAMLANEQGTRQDLDSEFLHDFRVAGRRTRSALTQIKGVLPAAAVEHFKQEFAWLGSATGPTRDMDVYLLKMPEYEASLPESVRKDLKPLRAFLERHQRLEQRRLVQALDSKRYQQLVRDWSAFLDQPLAAEAPPATARPIHEVASERIWRTYRKVAREGRAIDPETPAEAVHDLRIRCKKLRYLLEFFRSLYPAKQIGPLIASLKQLQDNLGDFNDYEVQQAAIAGFARQMRDEGETPVETLLAMGRLVDHLETGQANERRAFAGHFAVFDAPKNQARFRRLFAPKGGRR